MRSRLSDWTSVLAVFVPLAALPPAVTEALAGDGLPGRPGREPEGAGATEPAPAAPAGPWAAGLRGPERPFAETAFAVDTTGATTPDARRLREWFSTVAGHQGNVFEDNRQGRRIGGLDGVFRLRAPWPAATVLRLSVYDLRRFRLHVFRGTDGVSFAYHEHTQSWATYETSRAQGSPLPESFALAGADGTRFRRSGAGAIEVRHQRGILVLSRGDVWLGSAPMEGPPTEVYFEGRAMVGQIAVVRGEPVPEEPVPPRDIVLEAENPGELEWTLEGGAGGRLERLESGGVRLRSVDGASECRAVVSLAPVAWSDVTFLIEDASPGTGCSVEAGAGERVHRLAFFRDEKVRSTTFGFLPPGQGSDRAWNDPWGWSVPHAGRKLWLRVVRGPGVMKCWVSRDGAHWGMALQAVRAPGMGTRFSRIGLFALGAGKDRARSITLGRLEVGRSRMLGRLSAATPRGGLPDALVGGSPAADAWWRRAEEARPESVAADTWRRILALETLERGAPAPVSRWWMLDVIDRACERSTSARDRLLLLGEAALFSDDADEVSLRELPARYAALGRRLVLEGHERPFTTIRKAIQRDPLRVRGDLDTLSGPLARAEILGFVCRRSFEAVRELSEEIRFWCTPPDPRRPPRQAWAPLVELASWANAWARSAAGEGRGEPGALPGAGAPVPPEWRHPLVEELDRETYNLLADLDAVVRGDQLRDACRLITSIDGGHRFGLVPSTDDPDRLVSPKVAVGELLEAHPRMREVMAEEFGPKGLVRVRRAAAEGDVEVLEAVSLQFPRTEAAAEAEVWLGDRALARGDFLSALGRYDDALAWVPPARRDELRIRRRIAAALLGKGGGEADGPTVEVRGFSIGEEVVEAIENEFRARRAAPGPAEVAPRSPTAGVPPVAAYELRKFATFEPRRFGRPPGARPVDADWVGKRLRVSFAEDAMLVSDFVHAEAFDLRDGRRRWSWRPPGKTPRNLQWLHDASTPLALGDRVYVRALGEHGPELACLDVRGGGRIWSTRPGALVVSDPLAIGDVLSTVVLRPERIGIGELSFVAIDPDRGSILSERSLGRFRDVWNGRVLCRTARSGNRILISAAATVLSLSPSGELQWLRRQPWLPPSTRSAPVAAVHEAPAVFGETVLAVQPGVEAIQALDVRTGSVRWQRVLPRVRRLLGAEGGRVVVLLEDGMVALDATGGGTLWTAETPELLEVQVLGAQGRVLYAAAEPFGSGDEKVPVLVWLDAASGREVGRWAAEQLAGPYPAIGPVATHRDRTWIFRGELRRNQPAREIHELAR